TSNLKSRGRPNLSGWSSMMPAVSFETAIDAPASPDSHSGTMNPPGEAPMIISDLISLKSISFSKSQSSQNTQGRFEF
ncbi:MAG: hypothetical protein K2O79_01280, partial [Muribaculaceae bacterium]|nr:hypothetical protein [Muribaculaceae bacterium]